MRQNPFADDRSLGNKTFFFFFFPKARPDVVGCGWWVVIYVRIFSTRNGIHVSIPDIALCHVFVRIYVKRFRNYYYTRGRCTSISGCTDPRFRGSTGPPGGRNGTRICESLEFRSRRQCAWCPQTRPTSGDFHTGRFW